MCTQDVPSLDECWGACLCRLWSSQLHHTLLRWMQTQGAPPLATSHFSAEGDVEFKALMFIPPTAPYDFMNNYYQNAASLKLYVRRVFISDDFEDLIPR